MSANDQAVVDTTRDYYDSPDADNFYFHVWGGEDIHVGIYLSDGEPIRDASHRTVRRMVDALDLTHLRYPGGHAENTIDITRLDNGQLRAEVRAFMDWVVANSTPGHMIQVAFVLPTKVDIPAAQIEAFVYLLLQEYGDHVSGLEIGNEYSIGKRVDGFDRSTHPEDIPDSDFVSSMNETEYGIAANRVINAAQDAIDRLARDHPDQGHDPAILLQLGDISGAGSASAAVS